MGEVAHDVMIAAVVALIGVGGYYALNAFVANRQATNAANTEAADVTQYQNELAASSLLNSVTASPATGSTSPTVATTPTALT